MNDKKTAKTLSIFGQRVKTLREKKGFSVRTFANTVGIDPSTLFRIETGRADAKLTTVLAIAETLQVDVSSLLNDLS